MPSVVPEVAIQTCYRENIINPDTQTYVKGRCNPNMLSREPACVLCTATCDIVAIQTCYRENFTLYLRDRHLAVPLQSKHAIARTCITRIEFDDLIISCNPNMLSREPISRVRKASSVSVAIQTCYRENLSSSMRG